MQTTQSALTFDPVAAAEAAAGLTAELLFNRQRAARLIEYHARDAHNPDLMEVINAVAGATWRAATPEGQAGRVKEAVDEVLFRQLLVLHGDDVASPLVRDEVAAWMEQSKQPPLPARLLRMEDEFEKHPERFKQVPEVEAPPGQPIGEADCVRVF